MLSVVYAESHKNALYAECCYAECRGAPGKLFQSGLIVMKLFATVINCILYKLESFRPYPSGAN
jgi:hypothetical protein